VNFNNDLPIKTSKEDSLGRSNFSKQVAKGILAFTADEGLTIGLCGEWGCGKTSILNMALEEIVQETTGLCKDEKPIIVQFEPWNFSSTEQLLEQFFACFKTALNVSDDSVKLGQIGSILEKYSSSLNYLKYIPKIGSYVDTIPKLVGKLGKQLTCTSESIASDASAQKRMVVNELKTQKHKFIVVIDDIDRLTDVQIRAIFQLTSSIAHFPNVIYLLSFDKSVVIKALANVQAGSGDNYLEKIIQVPFDVPALNVQNVRNTLLNKLNTIYSTSNYQEFDEEHWQDILTHCLYPFIRNIRDVNRFINIFSFKFGILKEEVNFSDFVAVTALQVFRPQLLNWIILHKDSLCGSANSGISGVKQTENYQSYIKVFETICNEEKSLYMDVVGSIFPIFAWNCGIYHHTTVTSEELRHDKRIAHSSKFDIYFSLSLEEIPVSESLIQNVIGFYKEDEILALITWLKSEDNIEYFIEELACCIEKIPPDRIAMFAKLFLSLSSECIQNEEKRNQSNISQSRCLYLIPKLVTQISQGKNKLDLLMNLLKNATLYELEGLLLITRDMEETFGRWPESYESKYNQLLSLDDFLSFENAVSDRIIEFCKQICIYDWGYSYIALIILKINCEEKHDTILFESFAMPLNRIKRLSMYAGYWHGLEEGYNFNMVALDKEIDYATIKQDIISTLEDRSFWEMSQDQQRIVATYEISNQKREEVDLRVSLKDADMLLCSWGKIN